MKLDEFATLFDMQYKALAQLEGYQLKVVVSPNQPVIVFALMGLLNLNHNSVYTVPAIKVLAESPSKLMGDIWEQLHIPLEQMKTKEAQANPTLKQTMEQLYNQTALGPDKPTAGGAMQPAQYNWFSVGDDQTQQAQQNISSGTVKVYGLNKAPEGTGSFTVKYDLTGAAPSLNPTQYIVSTNASIASKIFKTPYLDMAKWEETAPKSLTELYGGVDWDQLWMDEGKHKKSKGSLKIKVQPKTAAQLQAAAKVEAQLGEMKAKAGAEMFKGSPLLKYITSKT